MVDFDEAMLDIAWKNLDTENKRHSDLDNKAIGLITITGILITFLLGSASTNSGVSGNKVLFVLTSLLFLVTVLISVLVLRIERVEVLSTYILLKELGEKDNDIQIKGVLGTMADMENKISDKDDRKATTLKYAIYCLSASIASLIFYVMSVTINISIK